MGFKGFQLSGFFSSNCIDLSFKGVQAFLDTFLFAIEKGQQGLDLVLRDFQFDMILVDTWNLVLRDIFSFNYVQRATSVDIYFIKIKILIEKRQFLIQIPEVVLSAF